MKVTVQDVQNAIEGHEKKKSFLDKHIINDSSLTKELKKFSSNLSLNPIYINPEQPLTLIDLFELCKILLTNPAKGKDDLLISNQLQEKIGINLFSCFHNLHQYQMYNFFCFEMVLKWQNESNQLKDHLPNKIFCECLYLLASGKLDTKPVLDWMMNLNQEKLTALHRVLSALNKHNVLDETFFPIFFSYSQHHKFKVDLTWEYGYLRPLISSKDLFAEEAKSDQEVLRELVQRINSDSLEERFNLFSQYVNYYWQNKFHKLSYAACGDPRTEDINKLFLTLILKGLLTRDRFNYILLRPVLVNHIDNLLRAMNLFKSEEDEATFRLHFDVLILLSREPALRHYISENKLEGYLEVTRAHSDSFIKIYTPFLLKLKDPYPFIWAFKTLIEKKLLSEDIFDVICSDIEYCKYKHHISPILLKEIAAHKSEQEFNALCDEVNPDRPKSKLNSILKLHELGVNLDNAKLTLMKKMESVQLYDAIQGKSKDEVEDYFKKAIDKEKLMERTKILFPLKQENTSYLYILPVDLLQRLPLYRGDCTHNEAASLSITRTAWENLRAKFNGEVASDSSVVSPETSTPMPDIQADNKPVEPTVVLPKP